MDSDTAWNQFKKNNQTSVEDKLDVILAQQQEILVDTSRTADLVPMVTGDKAQEDALEETGELEGVAQEEMAVEDALAGEEVPLEGEPVPEGTEITEEESATEEQLDIDEDNPFSFLDEDDESTEEDEEIEETDEESDVTEIEPDESEDATEEESEEEIPIEEESETESEEDEEDEEIPDEDENPEEDTEEDTEEEESEEESEDEDEKETKKSRTIPMTRTIKSLATKTPMTVVSKVSRPTDSLTYGRASSSEEVSEMLFKSTQEEFDIGYGVDPHKVVEKDWADYRMMKRLNSF